ncbi:MAG: hypothetical protein IJQ59_10690 [Bacteroidaceae bacterium]|nr:hypothetical protein [Bacteroidaceae bacterium]
MEETVDAYKTAISALTAATTTFTGAKADYEALVAAKAANAERSYKYADADKKAAAEASLTAEATSAADAKEKATAIWTAFRKYADSHALAESVEGAINMTAQIVNPNAAEAIAEPWAVVKGEGSGGSLNILDGEPLTDGEGNTYKYFDGGDWGANAWDVALKQTITLPAGKYMITASGRASGDVQLSLVVGEEKTPIPAIGASGGLFGNGWDDASMEFELNKESDVVIGVQGVTSVVHNWMSFTRFRLVCLEKAEEPVDPNDYTSYIVNADLTSDTGWDITGTKGYHNVGGVVTAGNNAQFDFKQTIENLLAGKYKVTAQAAYRYSGSEQAEYDAMQTDAITKFASLYATVGTKTVNELVQNRYDGASETDLAGEGAVQVNGLWVPNSTAANKAWFTAGKYVNEVVFNLPADGAVTIGIVKTAQPEVGDYTVIGPWTLTRLGDAEEEPEPETLKPGDDATSYITNPSFETGDLTGWTVGNSSDTGVKPNSNGTYTTEGCDGDYLFNTWWQGLPITQTVTGLPNGQYELKALMANDAITAGNKPCLYLLANGEHSEAFSSATAGVFAEGSMQFYVTNGTATIGAIGGNADGTFREDGYYWYKADNFRLTYVAALPGVDEIEIPDGKMSNAAATAITAAKEAGNSAALIDAVKAAKASIAAYVNAATAIAAAKAVQEGTNVATAEAATTFAAAIEAIETSYNDGSLSDDDAKAAGATLGTIVTGWREGADGAAVKFMESAYGLNGFDAALYINTWSNEGETDGSGFKVPFYEYFTDKANVLGANTFTTSVTGLEPGEYTATALIRVALQNDAEGTPAGVTLDANGGDAVAVDAEAKAYGTLYLKEVTAEGIVDESGVLAININVAAENNVHWVCFKNVKFAKKGAAPTTYAINIVPSENGKVEANPTTAAEGETVTITVTPDEGYMVDEVSITDGEDQPIEWQTLDMETLTGTFLMPAADVNVAFTFKVKEVKNYAEVKMTWVDYDNPEVAKGEVEIAQAGFNKIANGEVGFGNTSWACNWITYLQVDASAFKGAVKSAVLTFEGSGSTDSKRQTTWGVGYNSSEWSADMTYSKADKSITLLNATQAGTTKSAAVFDEYAFDITEAFANGKVATILIYETAAAGGYVQNPKVKVEMSPVAPEVPNASFEADGEKKASNGAIEMTGWTFAGVGTQFNNTELRSATTEGSSSQFGTSAPSDGEYSLFFRQGWNGGGNVITITSAALDEMPAGDYTLSIDYKQHYSYDNDNQKNDNTKVTIALKNGEDILGSETSPAAAGVKDASGDATYFNDTEWSTLTASFSIEKAVAAGAQVVITLNSAGARRSDFYLDNVKLTLVPGIELAKAELQKAIDAAQAEAAKYVVGEGIFMYAESEIAPLTTAIATATDALNDAEATKESINTAKDALTAFVETFAPQATLPDAEKSYTFQLRLDGETPLYMNLTADGITIAEEATALKFVTTDAAGQFNLANADETLFVGLAGGNAWTMSTAADKKAAWTFTALGDGAYRINNLVTAGRFVGTNAAEKEAGSPCYADKLTSNGNVDWIIAEYDETAVGIKGFATDDKRAAIYDLSGRKVEKIQRGGVYIIDGKKVSVK